MLTMRSEIFVVEASGFERPCPKKNDRSFALMAVSCMRVLCGDLLSGPSTFESFVLDQPEFLETRVIFFAVNVYQNDRVT